MTSLQDGDYDAIVIDIDVVEENTTRITFTITAGAMKGETVTLRATSLGRDPLDLLGLPAAIEVRDGAPHVRW